MNLKQQFIKETGCTELSPGIDIFRVKYISWLENRLQTIAQQSLSGSEPKGSSPKLPSLDDVYIEVKWWTDKVTAQTVYEAIKKLGNFA
jgi:hypothetical protein